MFFLGDCGGCVLPDRECFGGPAMCFQVQCISRYWELILRNGGELGVLGRESTGEKKAGYATRLCLVHGAWEQRVRKGQSRESATEPGMRPGE